MSLTLEEKAAYSKIIDAILKSRDLSTVTPKQVRKDLQAETSRDLTQHKDEVKDLINLRFDKVYDPQATLDDETAQTAATTNDVDLKQESPAVKRESSTAKKKPPSVKHEHEANGTVSTTSTRPLPIYEDAKLAARLQAEENSRARPTRGIAQRKTASSATKSSPKKKRTERSARKIKNEDDSGVESSGDHEVKKTGAFHKPYLLSESLSDLIGEKTLSRPQIVKKIWEHIKSYDLQNPGDKREILCDDAMRAVFKVDKIHMFTMNKVLAKHLYPLDE